MIDQFPMKVTNRPKDPVTGQYVHLNILELAAAFNAAMEVGRYVVHYTEDGAIRIEPLFDGEGIIYFVGFSRYVKIGFTTDIKSRLQCLQTACPERLIFYGSFKGTGAREKKLHAKFNGYRLQGEWFRFGEDIRKFVRFNDSDMELIRT